MKGLSSRATPHRDGKLTDPPLYDLPLHTAGEFGRTVYSQGKLTADDYGRDHHPRAFTIWMDRWRREAGDHARRNR